MDSGQERIEKNAQKILAVVQEAQELPEIEAGGGEQGVATVAGAAAFAVISNRPVSGAPMIWKSWMLYAQLMQDRSVKLRMVSLSPEISTLSRRPPSPSLL